MRTLFLLKAMTVVAGALTANAFSQAIEPAPSSGGATIIFRQVMPDGRIVYSDKAVRGAKRDHTITVEPLIKGNSWTTDAGQRPVTAQSERTPVRQVVNPPGLGKKKSWDEATTDVIRAEMLLEDAKKRQESGVEPLPGERTGNISGGSRLNEAYEARQKLLATEVAAAEAALKQAVADRDGLRPGAR
jgi:hypothetical protein